jgi:hypothetical protein
MVLKNGIVGGLLEAYKTAELLKKQYPYFLKESMICQNMRMMMSTL